MADEIQITLPEPTMNNKDLYTLASWQKHAISAKEENFYEVVSTVNQYLRFAFGVIALGIVVYAWFKLITAKGDEKEMKKLWGTLFGLIIWLFIAIFSYLIIKLIIKLI